MGRALLVLDTNVDRQKATDWIGKAPVGTRVEFKASKRTLPQNDMLWALLTEFAQQFTHDGKKYDPTQWKAIFLHAFGREISFLPSLDGKTFLPIEMSSSDLSKEEMTDFIEFILKEGTERGVVFKNPKEQNSVAAPPETDIEAGDSSPELPASNPSDDMRGQLIAFTAAIVGFLKRPLTEADKRYFIQDAISDWKYAVPEAGHAKMDSISLGSEAVIRGKRTLTQFINYVATDMLDCTVGELGG